MNRCAVDKWRVLSYLNTSCKGGTLGDLELGIGNWELAQFCGFGHGIRNGQRLTNIRLHE